MILFSTSNGQSAKERPKRQGRNAWIVIVVEFDIILSYVLGTLRYHMSDLVRSDPLSFLR